MERVILIRFGEIFLKGKNRGYFEKSLFSNIKTALDKFNLSVVKISGRYVVRNYNADDENEIVDRISKIPGIFSFSIADLIETSIENIENHSVELMKDEKGTFKVETNRADKNFTPNSMETSMILGGRLLDEFGGNLKVKVKEPDFVVHVDIREDGKTFVYTDVVNCISGMPVGSAGKGLLLISGGIDSPVAGYMMAKRGMKLNCLHFHSFPYTGEAAKEKVIELTKKVAEYNGGINLFVISFTHIQEAIHKHCPEEFMITIMRRFMMRIAERLAKQQGDQAIITGESLGQVASQTIESITSSNSVVTMPVLRPLIAFDKLDIIEISRKIDTYETSILPYEDCCTVFLPKFPAIKPNLDRVIRAESKLDIERLIDEAFKNVEKFVF